MKGMKKGAVITVISAVAISLSVACAERIRYVNRQLQDAPVRKFQTGETVAFEKDILTNDTMEGYSVRVDGAEILDYVQGPGIVCGLNTDLLGVANPQLDGVYAIALRENTELVLHLPFELNEGYFKERTWRHLDDLDMNLVATLYPVKKVIALEK